MNSVGYESSRYLLMLRLHFFFIRTKFVRTPTLRFLRRKKIRTIVDFKISLFIKGQANVSIIIPNPKVF